MGKFMNFMNKVGSVYNKTKKTLGKLYHPIQQGAHFVGQAVNGIDKFLDMLINNEVPILGELADVVKNNELYDEVHRLLNDGVQIVEKDVPRLAGIADRHITKGINALSTRRAERFVNQIGDGARGLVNAVAS